MKWWTPCANITCPHAPAPWFSLSDASQRPLSSADCSLNDIRSRESSGAAIFSNFFLRCTSKHAYIRTCRCAFAGVTGTFHLALPETAVFAVAMLRVRCKPDKNPGYEVQGTERWAITTII